MQQPQERVRSESAQTLYIVADSPEIQPASHKYHDKGYILAGTRATHTCGLPKIMQQHRFWKWGGFGGGMSFREPRGAAKPGRSTRVSEYLPKNPKSRGCVLMSATWLPKKENEEKPKPGSWKFQGVPSLEINYELLQL